MTKVEKKLKKQSIFPNTLESLPKTLEESLAYNRSGKERVAQVLQARLGEIERRLEAQERAVERREFYESSKALATKHLFRGLDLTSATKKTGSFIVLLCLLSSCKAIDSTHRGLEYREAQRFLEAEKADKMPYTLPYWKADWEKELTLPTVENLGNGSNNGSQKGGQEQ